MAMTAKQMTDKEPTVRVECVLAFYAPGGRLVTPEKRVELPQSQALDLIARGRAKFAA